MVGDSEIAQNFIYSFIIFYFLDFALKLSADCDCDCQTDRSQAVLSSLSLSPLLSIHIRFQFYQFGHFPIFQEDLEYFHIFSVGKD